MSVYRITKNFNDFNFSLPVQKTIDVGSFNCNYSASSTGDVISDSPLNIWNINTLPSSGTFAITPSTPLTIPFSNSGLPNVLFDAIVLLNLDGVDFIYGFSNSPDNAGTYASSGSTNPQNIFWVNLCRLRPNLPPQNAQAPINYYFGGAPVQYSSSSVPNLLKLNLLTPVLIPTTFNYVMEYISFNNQPQASSSGSVTLQPNSSYRDINFGNLPAGQSSTPLGHYRITVTCSNPNFLSALPFYHWGVSS
jgi:hypothetical protein